MDEALIVSCSDRKKADPGPAVLVYDGLLWRVLRQSLPRVELFALSARYGLIPAHRHIEPYDVTMARPEVIVTGVGEQWLDMHMNSQYRNIYLCMPQTYALFLAKVTTEYSSRETIFRIGEPGMGISQLSQALKKWCRRKQGEVPEWISLCLNDG